MSIVAAGLSLTLCLLTALQRLVHMRSVSLLPDALLAVSQLQLGEDAAEALSSLGSMADVAQCASTDDVMACTGIDQTSAEALISFWHSS